MKKIAPLLAALVLAGCASVSDHVPHGVNLSGAWSLNASLSDDPIAMMRGQHRGSRGGWNGRRPSGGGLERGHGRERDDRDDDESGPRPGAGSMRGPNHRGPFSDFLERASSLTIKQKPEELDLIADGVHTEFVYGERVSASVATGVADRVAGWNVGAFEVVWHLPEGAKASRHYALHGQQLIVITEASGGGESKIKYRAVYERAAPAG